MEKEVLPGIHCHGANVDGNAARQAQDFWWDVDPIERLRAVRHPGGSDPLRSGPKHRDCRIRDTDDVQKIPAMSALGDQVPCLCRETERTTNVSMKCVL